MPQSEIDNLKGMFPERLSEFPDSLTLFSHCFIVQGEIDEPIRQELDVFNWSDL